MDNAIKVGRDALLNHYALMTKNEILLHMAIQAEACDGKVKRNVKRFGQLLGKKPQRIRDAEYNLKRRRLLRVYWVADGSEPARWWHVYERPVGVEIAEVSLAAETESQASQHRDELARDKKSLWHRIRAALKGTELDDFNLMGEQS